MVLVYSPEAFITILLVASTVILSVMLLIFELPYKQYAQEQKTLTSAVQGFGSATYLTTITLTTVGYGDIYPNTDGGNAIILVTAVWGGFVASLLVLIVSNVFELNEKQKSAVASIKLNRSAARSIMHAMQYFVARKKLYVFKMQVHPEIIHTSKFLATILKSQRGRREADKGDKEFYDVPPEGRYRESVRREAQSSLYKIVEYYKKETSR